MAFTNEQLKGLNVASQRKILGQATADDIKNLDYATSKGYQFQPTAPAGKVAIPGAQYDTREKQQSAFTGIEPVGNTLYGIPINTTIPTDKLGEGSNIPPAQPVFGDVDAMMNGIKTGNEGLKATLEQVNTQLRSQEKKDAITARMDSEAEANKTAQRDLQEETWKRFGLGQNVEQLQALMPQIAKTQAEFDKFSVAQEGRIASASSIYGRQALIQRQKAVELAGLSAVAQAYQGNVEMARNIAKDAIDAQYTDQQNYMDNLKVQLDSIKDDLSREDQARATSLELMINERERAIEEEKYEAERKSDLMIAVARKGADAGTIKKIQNAKTYEEAIILSQPFLKDNISINDQMTLLEGGYRIGADGKIEVDTSSANASQIANAIKTIESNGNYDASGASGEFGAYQFMPSTWDSWSKEYARANNFSLMPSGLAKTPENQDAVAMFKINQWLAQGLTPEQIAAKWNSGSEVGWENKIGVNSKGVAYNVPAYVNKFSSTLGRQLGANKGEVSAMTELQASTIVTKISPRLANNKELIAQVAQLMASGVPMDEIEDELRYLSQSETFEPWRNLANTAFSGVKMAVSERSRQLDIVDDYIASGDNAGAVEHIKTVVLGAVGATEKKQVTGRDDALTSIYEIERLLGEYSSLGGNTGLLTGKVEDFNKKVLKRTGNSELAYIANEIAMAIQKYRQDLTGAAFTESEAKEYNNLFPSIGKSPELNKALIDSLKSQYERNQRKFWERQLGGSANYNKLEELGGSPIVGVGDLERFSTSSPMPITNNYLTNLGY